jgi:hypothetical protein
MSQRNRDSVTRRLMTILLALGSEGEFMSISRRDIQQDRSFIDPEQWLQEQGLVISHGCVFPSRNGFTRKEVLTFILHNSGFLALGLSLVPGERVTDRIKKEQLSPVPHRPLQKAPFLKEDGAFFLSPRLLYQPLINMPR